MTVATTAIVKCETGAVLINTKVSKTLQIHLYLYSTVATSQRKPTQLPYAVRTVLYVVQRPGLVFHSATRGVNRKEDSNIILNHGTAHLSTPANEKKLERILIDGDQNLSTVLYFSADSQTGNRVMYSMWVLQADRYYQMHLRMKPRIVLLADAKIACINNTPRSNYPMILFSRTIFAKSEQNHAALHTLCQPIKSLSAA